MINVILMPGKATTEFVATGVKQFNNAKHHNKLTIRTDGEMNRVKDILPDRVTTERSPNTQRSIKRTGRADDQRVIKYERFHWAWKPERVLKQSLETLRGVRQSAFLISPPHKLVHHSRASDGNHAAVFDLGLSRDDAAIVAPPRVHLETLTRNPITMLRCLRPRTSRPSSLLLQMETQWCKPAASFFGRRAKAEDMHASFTPHWKKKRLALTGCPNRLTRRIGVRNSGWGRHKQTDISQEDNTQYNPQTEIEEGRKEHPQCDRDAANHRHESQSSAWQKECALANNLDTSWVHEGCSSLGGGERVMQFQKKCVAKASVCYKGK